jgi:hypothetical protein
MLIAVTDPDGLISYCFAGPLDTAYEALDRTLVRPLYDEETVEQSCATLIDRTVLARIDFFGKLPHRSGERVHPSRPGCPPAVGSTGVSIVG